MTKPPYTITSKIVNLVLILSSVKNSVISSVNTEDKILLLLKENPTMTINQIAEKLNLTQRAIEKQISKLKNENRIKRIGSARKGQWEIVDGK